MTLKRLSAIALAVSTTLTLTACGGSEADTARGLANAPNPLVNNTSSTNTSNNTNTSNTSTTDNTSTSTGTGTNDTTNVTPNTTGNSINTTQNRPVVVETGTLTIASPLSDNKTITPETINFTADKTRNSLIQEMMTAYDTKDAYGNSRLETVAGYTATINGVNKRRNVAFQANELGANQGYNDLTLTEVAHTNIDGKRYEGERTARVQLYRGEHSMVLGSQTLSGRLSDGTTTKTLGQGEIVIDHIKGASTEVLPSSSTFTYNGNAFSQAGGGNFTYTVDFVDQSGHGKITGLSDKGVINLNQASIGYMEHSNYDSGIPPLTTYGIRGLAHFENGAKDGIYTLGFFGENAEEVAGVVTEDGDKHTVGFGGKR